MPDKTEVICPECWNTETVNLEIDDVIICSECGFEYYEDESLTD